MNRTLKQSLFAITACALSSVIVLAMLLALDIHLHKRFEDVAGLNIRGYRGPVLGRKQPGERRIAVLGGSTALGYGVAPNQSFPAYLERLLNTRYQREQRGPLRVVNLAGNGQGAYAFLPTLRQYRNVDCDLVILYEGYNDLSSVPNTFLAREASQVFRLTGYYPILPLILKEKAMSLRYGGDIESAYRGKATVFRPNLAARTTAAAFETAAHIGDSLGHQLGRLKTRAPDPFSDELLECSEAWSFYCHSVEQAIRYALERGQTVLVVTQPYLVTEPDALDDHIDQQRNLAAMLDRHFPDNPHVRYVNLGDAVDLKQRALCYDREHLTAAGNQQIAEHLVEPVWNALMIDDQTFHTPKAVRYSTARAHTAS